MMKKFIVFGVFFSLIILGTSSVSADVKAILKLNKRYLLNSTGTFFIPKKRVLAKSDDSITENTQIIQAKVSGPFSFDENITDAEMTISLNPLGLSSEVNPKVTSVGVTFSSKKENLVRKIKFDLKNFKKVSTKNGYIYSGLLSDPVAKGRFIIKVDDL
jgi:hypothetical protein